MHLTWPSTEYLLCLSTTQFSFPVRPCFHSPLCLAYKNKRHNGRQMSSSFISADSPLNFC